MAFGDPLAGLARLVLRVVLLLAALVVAVGLFFAAVVLAVAFGLRVLWARITGRPIVAWGMQIDPIAGWRRFRNRPAQGMGAGVSSKAKAEARAAVAVQDVEDVTPKERHLP